MSGVKVTKALPAGEGRTVGAAAEKALLITFMPFALAEHGDEQCFGEMLFIERTVPRE